MLNLVGEKYGRLTVVAEGPRKGNSRTWICKCDCGEEKTVRQSDLRSGKTLSCGCLAKEKQSESGIRLNEAKRNDRKPRLNLVGKVFGKLTVLEYDKEYTLNKNEMGKIYWKCQCSCGNIVWAETKHLNAGKVKSCGCLQKEKASKFMKEVCQPAAVKSITKDLSGQRFGKLVAIKLDEEKSGKGKGSFWVCQCDCGNIKTVAYYPLVSGATQSCGCLGNSLGEEKILNLLIDNNINFKQEVKFEDLKDEDFLRFDFAIYNDKQELIKLIEYNGRQHTDKTSCWYSDKLVKHDKMKINYCKDKDIVLLVIPYTDYEKIDLQYLGL